jgi:WD40 repeat protein
MPSDTVFLCHNSADKPSVEFLAQRLLKTTDIQPWLDKWNLIPGEAFTPKIEEALNQSTAIAVFLGPTGRSPYQHEEVQLAINSRGRLGVRVIPVLLPGASPDASTGLLANRNQVTFTNLNDTEAFRLLVCGIKGQEPGPPASSDPAALTTNRFSDGRSPYPGLTAFDVQDWDVFFGRDRLIKRAVDKLEAAWSHHDTARFLAIVGGSGSGKSSLSRAGIFHTLQLRHPGCVTRILVPGRQAETFAKLVDAARPEATGEGDATWLLLLVDQFEEVFTLWEDASARQNFIRSLCAACQDARERTVILITLRADFYENCARFPELAHLLSENQVLVGPMERDELRQAIIGPAAKAGYAVEQELVTNLVRDCEAQPSPLPLLQIVLTKLWEKRAVGERLTQALYADMSFEGAIDRHAEDVFDELPSQLQLACLSLFLQLAEPLPDGRFAKKRVPLDTLLPVEPDAAAVKQVESLIGKLASWQARLISISSEGHSPVVEVAHEAIFRSWKRLAAWLDKNSEFLLWKKRLDVSVSEWRRNHDRNCCLTGKLLTQALLWLRQRESDHTPEEKEFLRASLNRKRWRAGMWASWAAVVLALMTGIIVSSRNKLALQQLTENARHLIKARRPIALILALEAGTRQPNEEHNELLQLAVQAFSSPLLASTTASPSDGGFSDLVFSPDGVRVAAAANAGALLWAPASTTAKGGSLFWSANRIPPSKSLMPAGGAGTGQMLRVAFSRDGKFLAATAADQSADAWRTDTGALVFNIPKQAATISAIALAGNGRHALLALDNQILWWNGAAGKAELSITASGHVSDLALSADDSAAAAAQSDGNAQIWLLASGTAIGNPMQHNLPTVRYVAYAADGKLLATAESPGAAYLWKVPAGASTPAEFREPDQPVVSASISADGLRLATLNHDQSISIWETASGKRLTRFDRVLEDFNKPEDFNKIGMSGDGKHLAAALKNDPKIRLYELEWSALRQRALEVIVDQRQNLADCAHYLPASTCSRYLQEATPQ